MDYVLDDDLLDLIMEGNLPLVKKFVEAGFKLPSIIPAGQHEIKNNTVETINFLVENGFDISQQCWSICSLLQAKKLCAADFELYLENGLRLEYENVGTNWQELALMTSNLDIASLLYNRRFRLSHHKNLCMKFYNRIQENVDILVKLLTIQAEFNSTIKLLYAGNMDMDSVLSYIPFEVI